MAIDISKLCADAIRANPALTGVEKLKSSHAHELVAAYFGYKSRASMLADAAYPLGALGEAAVLCPDIRLMDARRPQLDGLPASLASSRDIASYLCDFLKAEGLFAGEVWLYEDLEHYIMEVYLPAHDYLILDELSGVMAETNAQFDEPYYEDAIVNDAGDAFIIDVTGTYYGSNDPDKPFSGDQIDMKITVTLPRVSGRTAFGEPDLDAGGAINDDWVDPELRYGMAE